MNKDSPAFTTSADKAGSADRPIIVVEVDAWGADDYWMAFREGNDGRGPYGYGATGVIAKTNLLELERR